MSERRSRFEFTDGKWLWDRWFPNADPKLLDRESGEALRDVLVREYPLGRGPITLDAAALDKLNRGEPVVFGDVVVQPGADVVALPPVDKEP